MSHPSTPDTTQADAPTEPAWWPTRSPLAPDATGKWPTALRPVPHDHPDLRPGPRCYRSADWWVAIAFMAAIVAVLIVVMVTL